jgi:hypothetical protein
MFKGGGERGERGTGRQGPRVRPNCQNRRPRVPKSSPHRFLRSSPSGAAGCPPGLLPRLLRPPILPSPQLQGVQSQGWDEVARAMQLWAHHLGIHSVFLARQWLQCSPQSPHPALRSRHRRSWTSCAAPFSKSLLMTMDESHTVCVEVRR